VFLAQPVVVAEVVTLVLQGVERFIFNPPSGAPGAHDLIDVFTGEGKVRNPTETCLFTLGVDLPVLQNVDQDIRV
jgi:hypothetical protein